MKTYRYFADLFKIPIEEVIAGIAEAHTQPLLMDLEYEVADSGIMYKFPDFEITSTLDPNVKHLIQGFFLKIDADEDGRIDIRCKRHILLDTEFRSEYIHSHASGRDDKDRWRSFCWGSQHKPLDMLKTMAKSEIVNFTESYTAFMSYIRHYLTLESTESGPYRLITQIKPPYEDIDVRVYSDALKFFIRYITNVRIDTVVDVESRSSYFENPVNIRVDIDLDFDRALRDYKDQSLTLLQPEPLDSAGNVITRVVPDWKISTSSLKEFGGGVYFKNQYYPFILLLTERVSEEPYAWGISNNTKDKIKNRLITYLSSALHDKYTNKIKNGYE